MGRRWVAVCVSKRLEESIREVRPLTLGTKRPGNGSPIAARVIPERRHCAVWCVDLRQPIVHLVELVRCGSFLRRSDGFQHLGRIWVQILLMPRG